MAYNIVKTASVTDSMIRNQAIRAALPDAGVGAAVGAGVGGLLGLVGPHKNRLRRALMFALGGSVLGGAGAGIASYNGKSLLNAVQDKLDQWRASRAIPVEAVDSGTSGANAMQQAYEEEMGALNMLDREPSSAEKTYMGAPDIRPAQQKMHPAVSAALRAKTQGERDYWLGVAGLLPPMN